MTWVAASVLIGHSAGAVGAQHENMLKESKKKLEGLENTGEDVKAAVPALKEALSRQFPLWDFPSFICCTYLRGHRPKLPFCLWKRLSAFLWPALEYLISVSHRQDVKDAIQLLRGAVSLSVTKSQSSALILLKTFRESCNPLAQEGSEPWLPWIRPCITYFCALLRGTSPKHSRRLSVVSALSVNLWYVTKVYYFGVSQKSWETVPAIRKKVCRGCPLTRSFPAHVCASKHLQRRLWNVRYCEQQAQVPFSWFSVLCICALAEAVAQGELLQQSIEGLAGQTTKSGEENASCLEQGSYSDKSWPILIWILYHQEKDLIPTKVDHWSVWRISANLEVADCKRGEIIRRDLVEFFRRDLVGLTSRSKYLRPRGEALSRVWYLHRSMGMWGQERRQYTKKTFSGMLTSQDGNKALSTRHLHCLLDLAIGCRARSEYQFSIIYVLWR